MLNGDELAATQLLTTAELAKFLRKTPVALAVERSQRRDTPPWVKLGRKILYRKQDVLDWLDAHSVSPASANRKAPIGSGEQAGLRDERRAFSRRGGMRFLDTNDE
jgi:hypothetical protein